MTLSVPTASVSTQCLFLSFTGALYDMTKNYDLTFLASGGAFIVAAIIASLIFVLSFFTRKRRAASSGKARSQVQAWTSEIRNSNRIFHYCTVLSRGVQPLFEPIRKSSPWGNLSDGGLNQSINQEWQQIPTKMVEALRSRPLRLIDWLIDDKLTLTWLSKSVGSFSPRHFFPTTWLTLLTPLDLPFFWHFSSAFTHHPEELCHVYFFLFLMCDQYPFCCSALHALLWKTPRANGITMMMMMMMKMMNLEINCRRNLAKLIMRKPTPLGFFYLSPPPPPTSSCIREAVSS